jgi:hypothetical protein
MRLINAKTLRLEEFMGDVPKYTILSHTWGNDEVTFQDMAQQHEYMPTKRGFHKIQETCRLALEMNLEYAWVDTCCIDKTSSAELTESINSMFQWYESAAVCFVWLNDLSPDESFADGARKSRWITRGWTLQELIAPSKVYFYDQTWKYRSAKVDSSHELAEMSGIPEKVLAMDSASVERYSVAQRMSWASRRQTTRVEDMAYCLLGLFKVNMPLIYGEGLMAFRRLQEEIIKRTNDMTIFVWNPNWEAKHEGDNCGLIASSPALFRDSGDITPWKIYHYNPEFSITNRGLRIEDYLCVISGAGENQTRYIILLGVCKSDDTTVGIYLQKVGGGLFVRQTGEWIGLKYERRSQLPVVASSTFHIMTDAAPPDPYTLSMFQTGALRVPFPVRVALPDALWDVASRLFYADYLGKVRVVALEQQLAPHVTAKLLVLVYHGEMDCVVLDEAAHPALARYLHGRGNQGFGVAWKDAHLDHADLRTLTDRLDIAVGESVVTVTARLVREKVFTLGHYIDMTRLEVEVENTGQ